MTENINPWVLATPLSMAGVKIASGPRKQGEIRPGDVVHINPYGMLVPYWMREPRKQYIPAQHEFGGDVATVLTVVDETGVLIARVGTKRGPRVTAVLTQAVELLLPGDDE